MPKTYPPATPSATLRASHPAAHGVILLTRQPTTATSLKKKDTVSFNKMSSGTTTSSFAPNGDVRVPNTSAELQLTQLELLTQQLPLLPRIELLTQQLQRAIAELQQGNGFATEPPKVAVQAALTADERASHPAQANSEDSPRSESTADEPVPEMSHVEPRASVCGPVDLDVADEVNADAIAAMQKREQMLKEKADVADGVPQSDDGDNNGTAEANTLRGIDSPSPHDDEVAEDAALNVDADETLLRRTHEQGDINRDDKEDIGGSQLPAPPSPAEMNIWRVNCIAAHKELTEKNTLKLLDTQQISDKFLHELICSDAEVAEKIGDAFREHLSNTPKGYQMRLDAILKVVETNTPAMVDGDVINLTGDESDDSAIAVPDSDHDHAASEDGDASNTSIKKRRPYRCSNCRETGHDKRKCPLLAPVVSHNSIGDPGAQAPAPTGVVRTTGSVEVNPTEEGRRDAKIITTSMEMEGRKGFSSTAQAQSAQEPALPPQSLTVWRPDVSRFPWISNGQRRLGQLRAISEQETNEPNRLDHVKNGEGRENVRPRDETCDLPNQCQHEKREAKKARINLPADPRREKARAIFLEVMKTAQGEASSGQSRDESELAAIAMEVEKQLYAVINPMEYNAKARGLVSNLKDPKNPRLRANVLTGDLPAARLVRMSTTELANEDLQAMRAEREAMIGEDAFLPEPGADPQTGIDLERQHSESRQK